MVKIQFSKPELELMCDAPVILTKNKVIRNIITLFESMGQDMVEAAGSKAESSLFTIPPKVSKGENYRGLPYVVLDYPRVFQSDIFAIRTFFWWGNFFSSTLHLSGSHKEKYLDRILDSFSFFAENEYYIGVQDDPWQHHFEKDNFISIRKPDKDSFTKYCMRHSHLKIAKPFPLDPDTAGERLMNSWDLLLGRCGI